MTLLIAAARATFDEPVLYKRLSLGAVLLFFVISLLCWSDTGSWANGIPINVVSLLQNTLTAARRQRPMSPAPGNRGARPPTARTA